MSLWNYFIHADGANVLSEAETFPINAAMRIRVQTFHGNTYVFPKYQMHVL